MAKGTKLTIEQQTQIAAMAADGSSREAIAKRFGVTVETIGRILRRRAPRPRGMNDALVSRDTAMEAFAFKQIEDGVRLLRLLRMSRG